MNDHAVYSLAAYAIGCLALFAFLLLHTSEDDDVTVGDALCILVVSFMPVLNVAIALVLLAGNFSASGASFADRILVSRRRK